MDAVCGLDDWEVLPDQTSSFSMEEYCGNGHGGNKGQLLLGAKLVMVDMDHFAAAPHRGPYGCVLDDEEAKKPLLLPSRDVHGRSVAAPVTEFKDIGVVHMESKREEEEVTEILISDAEGDQEEAIKFPDAVTKEVVQEEVIKFPDDEAAALPGHRLLAGEDDDDDDDEGVVNIGFSVGNLRVHGVGALCSFGVAAATFCIFLLGGGKQQHQRQIQLQMYADDQRIQRVTQQASRLNQAMGGAPSARASISFGGHYRGFR